jgi:rare lipoprotein A
MAALACGAMAFRAPAALRPAANDPSIATSSCPDDESWAKLDCSGRTHAGIASFYAARFGGRKMADGTPMRLQGDNAASKTLPLGTIAIVTNLETGRSSRITIRDRGPYVQGRIVDLSPATARKIGMTIEQGLAPVAVAPLRVPLPDGTLRLGEAALRRHAANR